MKRKWQWLNPEIISFICSIAESGSRGVLPPSRHNTPDKPGSTTSMGVSFGKLRTSLLSGLLRSFIKTENHGPASYADQSKHFYTLK
jgi:hypothetical protein